MATKNSFGNSGNRWWVGLNVGSDQSTLIGTGSILSPNGYEPLPSGNATDDALFAAAAAKDAVPGAAPVTISVEHVNWYNINGPYSTKLLAYNAINAIKKAHPAPGEVQQVTAGGQGNAANGGGINPTSWEQAITDFISDLSSANLWIRAVKILAGGALVIVAISSMTGAGPAVVKKAVKAAPLL